MKKVKKKEYFRITLTVESPLGISSGDNINTDKDIIRNSVGEPYIPATAIAGVVREILSEGKIKDEYGRTKEVDDYFGYVLKESDLTDKELENIKKDKISLEKDSSLTFYNAKVCEDKKPFSSIRDSVSLDKYKTAEKGAKFDMEIIEPGAKFVTYLHQDFFEESGEEDYVSKVVEVLAKGVLLGGKTSRGYGKVRAEKIESVSFNISDKDELEEWLKFDFSESDKWEKYEVSGSSDESNSPENWKLVIGLEQAGGISIRKYITDPHEDDENQPDMEQLTAHGSDENGEDKEEPVIPGTTWAGAFRHRMEEFKAHTNDDSSGIFGFVKDKEKGRSRISFSESRIHGAESKILSRNAIDRFTGGTAKSALFTEKTWYGGTTELEISWKYVDYQASNTSGTTVSKEMPDEDQKALAAALTDLHMGFLSIGGETSIGRGLFRINKINKTDMINEKPINTLVQIGTGDPENEADIYGLIYQEIKSLAASKERDG